MCCLTVCGCRIGFHSDALEVAYLALDSHPNFVVNHFTVGNIHTSMVGTV